MSNLKTHYDQYLDLEALEKVKELIAAEQQQPLQSIEIVNKELTAVVRRMHLVEFMRFVRDHHKCQFKLLVDICGVDWKGSGVEKEARFEVVYHLLSLNHNLRLRVKVPVDEGESVHSLVDVYAGANWFERETYDMFGILFENHPDLRRILSDYDFDGHPLRKDFPLQGHVEVYYDVKEERVAYKPSDQPQEFRHFDKKNAWSGITANIHLAEEDNAFSSAEFGTEDQEPSNA